MREALHVVKPDSLMALVEKAKDVKAAIEDGDSPPSIEDQAEQAEGSIKDTGLIERLSNLSLIDYDRERQAAADSLGIRATTLDAEVKRARTDNSDNAAGQSVVFPDRIPWSESVDGSDLLDDLASAFKRFVILPDHADTALSLWILFTYLADVARVAPILAAVSPEKRCGKTTLLALLNRLVDRPLTTSNISSSSLFRAVEKWSPTLLIDEADTFLRENEELRGILNCGHTRDTAFIIRTVGDDHEPRRFSTWSPKAIALIGSLPDTLADRSIVIELRRKHSGERVEKLRHADLEDLTRRCIRFADDYRKVIESAQPKIPEELHDRAGDNWEPLLAIADLAGGSWPERARKAASILSGSTPDGDSTKVELLTDIRALFSERLYGRELVSSAELVELLTEDKAGRWAEYSHGKPLTQGRLARLLRPFKITSGSVRVGADKTPKGYHVKAFDDAFARYLPPFKAQHRHNPHPDAIVADFGSATDSEALHFEKAPQPASRRHCGGVALSNLPPSDEERF